MTDYLKTTEVAEILKISPRRVQALAAGGRLGRLVHGRYLFTQSEVRRFARIPRPVGNPTFGK